MLREDKDGRYKHINNNSSSKDESSIKSKGKSREKGKYASSTENRRLVWNNIVWPLILELNKPWFTIEEYHAKRDAFCSSYGDEMKSKVAGGFVSLIVKGLLLKDKDREVYSIHWKLVPYMRKRLWLDYGEAIRLISTK
ncbi:MULTISPECIES: hypothetical protein [Candidatus Nitrosocaldus]|uniref:Uncharacterized protein n=1 Tax=Candidatus Nitrosocaldus cavascurensis TaxID=2058097 RepID=A0A2K5ASL4_9ARCH|nr:MULTISPECIES: hypothetical protein [Candidatus Nitrosocaldus]GBC74564.1 hypothetical protein HRbin05_00606 [archaeon HR05]SPC34594.1 conserved protein of unknown function [Candidatus Nitrosocaldus cavascurensis]